MTLPGYDSKLPKVYFEYREGTYDEIFKRYFEANISNFYIYFICQIKIIKLM